MSHIFDTQHGEHEEVFTLVTTENGSKAARIDMSEYPRGGYIQVTDAMGDIPQDIETSHVVLSFHPDNQPEPDCVIHIEHGRASIEAFAIEHKGEQLESDGPISTRDALSWMAVMSYFNTYGMDPEDD